MKKQTKRIIVLIVSLFILIALMGIAAFNGLYGKMNYKNADSSKISDSDKEEYINGEQDQNLTDADGQIISEIDKQIAENIENAEELDFNDGVFNILLIGSDERETVSGSRSDCMILCSLNEDTKKVTLTSFMRDSYVSIPGHENNRLNAAYAFGGTELLIDTIEQNFKIPIDRYVKVDFFAFMDIVDMVGGIDMTLSDDEIRVLNDYLNEVNMILGEDGTDRIEGPAGTYHLNGKQTLAYSRNRYTGNSDFSRTERQRKILLAIKDEVSSMNVIELYKLVSAGLPYVTTDITESEFLSLLVDFPGYIKNDISSNRVPYDGAYSPVTINKMAVLSLDFNKNIENLQKDIYNK